MSLLLPLMGGSISNLTLTPVPPQLRWTTRFNGLFKAESAKQHVDVECGDHFTDDKKERERSWMRDNNCTDVEKVAMFLRAPIIYAHSPLARPPAREPGSGDAHLLRPERRRVGRTISPGAISALPTPRASEASLEPGSFTNARRSCISPETPSCQWFQNPAGTLTRSAIF